jgi:hypothetical protein
MMFPVNIAKSNILVLPHAPLVLLSVPRLLDFKAANLCCSTGEVSTDICTGIHTSFGFLPKKRERII